MKSVYAAILLVVLVPARAEQKIAVEWFQSIDRLSKGNSNWRSEELRLSDQIAQRHAIDATLRQTNRFGLSDAQVEINYSLPLTKALTGSVTASDSATHRVLPKTDLGAGLQYEFAPAWLFNVGAKRTEYDNASVSKASLGLEHYFSAFRWAIGWQPTRAVGVTAHGGDARLDYYYSDTSWIGIQLAAGQEAANIGAGGVVVASVRSAALIGRHRFTEAWTVRYGIERVKQGDFYNRTGARLGAQYTF